MTTAKDKYKSIEGPSTSIFKDRGSKFLGYAFPVKDNETIKSKINDVKKEHPKATHHCYAYRLGTDGLNFRANDDGEPSGSAGRPILGQIDSAGLCNLLVIVVRYYGGTMLGVPGLINAYKTTCATAIQSAQIVEKWITQKVVITTDYNALSEVLYWLKNFEAEILQQDLQLFCSIKAEIPKTYLEQCALQLSKIRGLEIKNIS